MRKPKLRLLALGLSLSLFVGTAAYAEAPAGNEAPQEAAATEDSSVHAGVTEIQKYGNIMLDISGNSFAALGYEYGDIVSVQIAGQVIDMPVGSNYSDVDNGKYICRVVKAEDETQSYVVLAINMGDLATTLGIATKTATEGDPGFLWTYNPGFDESMTIDISMKEKGGYATEYMMHQLSRTNERSDYPSLTDEQFANFRSITTTGMGENVLFRSSSPVNPTIGRNTYADAAAAAHGIRTVVNLADSEETMKAYEGFASTYYAGCNTIALNLGVDFSAPDFRTGLSSGLRFMAAGEAPFLIHCTEGKDRAGFVSALLECLMGASADEVITDYMTSYTNYYGVGPADPRYPVIAQSNIAKTLATAFGVENIQGADLAACAENYLLGTGLTADEIAALKAKLGPAAEEPETEPATEEPATEPATAEPATEPATAEPATEPLTEEAETEPLTEEAETEPLTEEAETEPLTEEAETEPLTEEAETEPLTEEAETEPLTEEAGTEPLTEEPATAESETEPATAEPTTAEPATAESSTAEPTTEALTQEATTEAPSQEATTEAATEPSTADPAAKPEPAAEKTLPAAGETVSGFTVKEIREFPLVGATALLFEHDKTGAELMYIANGDTNRTFDLTFFTRAVDNTGLPHIFEHATTDGSEKYPSKSLFFNLSYQTYNTYMNASTYQNMTTYPVSSLSEAQLLKYADYYTDSCFNPIIMEDESIFNEEAWRYRLASAEDDLTIEGTVYSEMLGALTLSRMAAYNNMRTALPGSYAGNISGGDPAFIPDMTYEDLRNYHDYYYHPSNCIAYLYGDFENYEAFLALLDAEFSKYEKKEFSFEEPDYTPITEAVTAEYPFGVEASSNTERAAYIYYSYVIPGLKENEEQELLINTLTDILGTDGSPLMIKLHDALPAGTFGCYIETEGPEDLLVFYASQVDLGDADTFRTAVDEALAEVAEKGFAADLVEGIASSVSLSIRLSTEGDNVGVDIIPSLAYNYSTDGRPFSYLDYVDALTNLEEANNAGKYQQVVKDLLLDNKLTALSTTYPVPGLKEEQDAALAQSLQEYKDSLTEEELQAIIDQTNAVAPEDDASSYVAQLQAVTVSSLPEEVKIYDLKDETGEDGIRRASAVAGVDGIGQVAMFIDASALMQEDILWFHLYTDLIGEMDTASHTRDELAVLAARYLYDGEIRLSLLGDADAYHPYLRFGWKGVDEDLADAYNLVYEVLYETDFSDADRLLSLIQSKKSGLKTDITNNIYSIQIYRAFAITNQLYRYYNYYNYIDYYMFLDEVEQLAAESPALVSEKLDGIARFFHNRCGAMSAFAGNEKSIALNRQLADEFLAKLDGTERDVPVYDLPVPASREGIIIDSAVCYNALVADYEALGLEDYNAGMDAVTALVSDAYLYPMLRDQYGAYGALHGAFADGGIYTVSYRDPNVAETFDVYENLPEFISGYTADQETLDGYILSSYSYYAKSSGELSGAMNALINHLDNEEQEETLELMKELKAVTPETFAQYAVLYEKLAENGVRSTAGGAAAINANAELYDQILNPFGAKDATEIELVDVPEDHPYHDAIREVFEEGFMAPLTEDTFGVDEPAVLGDLAAALYVAVGGDQNAPDDAVAFLAGYGIVAEDAAADEPLTDGLCKETIYNFTAALGMEPEEPAEAEDKVIARGELAQIIIDYLNGLE